MKSMATLIVAVAVFGGVAAAEETKGMPANIAKELGFYVGEWTVQGNVGGKEMKGRWASRWSPQRQCLLINSQFTLEGERVWSNGVSGWDAGREEIVTVQFFSNGTLEDTRYKLTKPGVMKGLYSISSKGGLLNAKCEVQTNGSNEWTFSSTVNAIEGKKEAEFTLRCTRLEAKPKKERGK